MYGMSMESISVSVFFFWGGSLYFIFKLYLCLYVWDVHEVHICYCFFLLGGSLYFIFKLYLCLYVWDVHGVHICYYFFLLGGFLVFHFQIIPMFVCMGCPWSPYLSLYESQLIVGRSRVVKIFLTSNSSLMSLLDWKWQYYHTFLFINYQLCPAKRNKKDKQFNKLGGIWKLCFLKWTLISYVLI